jgi:hypothetical protein
MAMIILTLRSILKIHKDFESIAVLYSTSSAELMNDQDQQQVYLTSLFQQYQTREDLLLKHQLDSQVKCNEALAISERIILLNTQAIEERVRLDGVEKRIAEDVASIEVICGCDGGTNASSGESKVFDASYVLE